jgi:epoxyqueuosine reductase
MSEIYAVKQERQILTVKYSFNVRIQGMRINAALTEDDLVSNLCPENCSICLKSCPQSAVDGITVNHTLYA